MQFVFACCASGLATIWLVVHVVLGGRDVSGPLRHATDIPDTVRITAWMCWHMVTAVIAVLAVLPLLAVYFDMGGLMVSAVLLAAALSIAGIASQVVLKARFMDLPQGWLFAPVAGFAWLAL